MIIVTEENYVELFQTKPYTPKVGVDMDGTLNTYDGIWRGEEQKYSPLPDADILLSGVAKRGYTVCIMTARRKLDPVYNWLIEYNLDSYVSLITNWKVPCFAYIDDRNILYKGNAISTLADLDLFTTWWKTSEDSLGIQKA